MREILFRGKCGDKWIYGTPVYTERIYVEIIEIDPNYAAEGGWYSEFINEDTLGQYIGLEDKNGIKVFEGDIVEIDYEDKLMICEWDDKSCRYWLRGAGSIVDFDSIYPEEITVVGNKYDNPELL